jgi:hypothetical protein
MKKSGSGKVMLEVAETDPFFAGMGTAAAYGRFEYTWANQLF